MTEHVMLRRKTAIGVLGVTLLATALVVLSPASPASAATSSQYAASWTTTGTWSPAAPNAAPLGVPNGTCTFGDSGATADFTFTGFAIPATDVIDGIEVVLVRRSAQSQVLQLRDGASLLGTSKTLAATGGANNCGGTVAGTAGSTTDTWGVSPALTPAAINDGFGVRLNVANNGNIRVDSIRLVVHHSAAAPPDPEADLSITKTDGVTSVTAGEQTTYTIVASNAGPDAAPTATVADTFPTALTGCTWTATFAGGATGTTSGTDNINQSVSLPAGGSATYTATCTLDAAATGTLANTATVASATTDPTPANNSATDTDTITAPPDPEADLSITKTDGVTSLSPGDTVAYIVIATNQGPDDDPAVLVTDDLPDALTGCTWTAVFGGGASGAPSGNGDIDESVSLPDGGSATYTVSCTVADDAAGTVANTAEVAGTSSADPTPGDNAATDTDTVVVPSADVSVAISESSDPVTAGDAAGLTYVVTVADVGPDAADDVAVDVGLTLPSGVSLGTSVASVGSFDGTSWTVGALANGGSATLTFPVTVDDTTTAGTDVIALTADGSTSTGDDVPANDAAAEATSVLAATTPTTPTTPTTEPATPTTEPAAPMPGPTSPSTPSTPTSPSGAVAGTGRVQAAGQSLPRTGSDVLDLGLLGIASIVIGAGALWLTRRERAGSAPRR